MRPYAGGWDWRFMPRPGAKGTGPMTGPGAISRFELALAPRKLMMRFFRAHARSRRAWTPAPWEQAPHAAWPGVFPGDQNRPPPNGTAYANDGNDGLVAISFMSCICGL